VQQIYERVAGLDVHRDNVVACFRRLGARGGVVFEKDRFATTTKGLRELESWLTERQVELVAMEATGVYWKPVLYALESRFTVWLCNARAVKKVPGRKTDLTDAEWLADVAAHGMIRPSFVPPPPIRELRELTKSRTDCVSCADLGPLRWSSSSRRIRLSAARLRWRGVGRWAESSACWCACLTGRPERSR
jgi:transposase